MDNKNDYNVLHNEKNKDQNETTNAGAQQSTIENGAHATQLSRFNASIT